MNDTEVTKTIQQMVRFIKQEAEEKSAEIAVAAEEEFNITKLQLLEAEKAKVRKEYDRREKAIEVKKKVEYSKQLNESRIKVLQARDDAVQGIMKEAQSRLSSLSSNKAVYEKLVLDLVVQGLRKLGEETALVRCREIDLDLVKGLLPKAAEKYASTLGRKAPSISVDASNPLPPPPSGVPSDEFASCCGGVVVTSADGRVVCSNTLDDRLRIAYTTNLPLIRSKLFGDMEE